MSSQDCFMVVVIFLFFLAMMKVVAVTSIILEPYLQKIIEYIFKF